MKNNFLNKKKIYNLIYIFYYPNKTKSTKKIRVTQRATRIFFIYCLFVKLT